MYGDASAVVPIVKNIKQHIRKYGYTRKSNNLTERHFKQLAKLNITKANFILNNAKYIPEYSDYCNISNQGNLLEIQISKKNNDNKIFVINTCMMFIVDYFGEKYYRDIKRL